MANNDTTQHRYCVCFLINHPESTLFPWWFLEPEYYVWASSDDEAREKGHKLAKELTEEYHREVKLNVFFRT